MAYLIPDEPRPTSLSRFAFRPTAPLVALMLSGAWLAWPWFAFNAFALGSPTRRKELALTAVAALGSAVLAATFLALYREGIIESDTALRLGLLAISTFKLGMGYAICQVQERTFHVYSYYGGTVRPAYGVLLAGYYLRSILLGGLDDPFWIIIISVVL
jgi:hypothetical protein